MSHPSGSGHFYECEVNEDIAHQRLVWRYERVFWVLWALIIVAALLGLLGHGPLSGRTLAPADTALQIHYNRFERYQSESVVTVQVQADAERGPLTRLVIAGDYLQHFQISYIEPPPVEVEAWPGYHVYVFNLPEPNGPVDLIFHLQPISFGNLETTIRLEGRAEQRLSQFIFP